MSGPVVKVENLSKEYRLGVINRRMLYHELESWWARLRGREDPNAPIGHAHVENGTCWALQDVSFEVAEGEVVGIIGGNGAGKSTLLKILSQITAPTSGKVYLRGRVASLLEVGTGFHPELTGRENVFLNGSILGMRRREIVARFDEIAAFSGVEEFLETPVKRYSSGMRVRLAFAVAAYLDPEILIIDEVLAVGDAAFQQKCLGKLNDVAREGRTVLFVSHNMAAVENLCRRGIVLVDGKVFFAGSQAEAIACYMHNVATPPASLADRAGRAGNGAVVVTGIAIYNPEGTLLHSVASGQDIEFRLEFENRSRRPFPNLAAGIKVINQFDMPVFTQFNRLSGEKFGDLPARGSLVCRIAKLPLPPAVYRLGFTLQSDHPAGEVLDVIDNALEFTVTGGDFFRSGILPPARKGACLVDASWRIEKASEAVLAKIST